MREPYNVECFSFNDWRVCSGTFIAAYANTEYEARNKAALLNHGYTQGRRDALAEIEARNKKREEL